MNRRKKKELIGMISTLKKANQIMKNVKVGQRREVLDMLAQCQEAAFEIGNYLETQGEAGKKLVEILEDYCENLYKQTISLSHEKQCRDLVKSIQHQLTTVENGICQNFKREKKEVVFLPYKVSMWDSLESIWMAAEADENCNAYVVPIPYFDKKSDGSFGKMHYEGEQYPDYVPITSWKDYDIKDCEPNVIYIHNPYDDNNHVTSVHPAFYSKSLREYTDQLVYVPYYATSGGMSEGQSLCPAYMHADYIVIQSEKYRNYFDKLIPDKKFLPFGSPKFDRIIRKCQNPPQIPEQWKEKMDGKKVYFYNTSINGILENTASFLKKMEYVFRCFEGRKDVCLLWRPHPLLESTLVSMRPQYIAIYDKLKSYFQEQQIGIYDTTPDVNDTIALCDAYVGDAATSITALFGITGKPIFILNNRIHSKPFGDDWKGETMIRGFNAVTENKWLVTQGNKLYYSSNNDYHYRYYCDLSEYSQGAYYSGVWDVEGKIYVCPCSAQDILLIGEHGIEEKINLKRLTEKSTAFYTSLKYEHYLLLIPYYYPAVVRYDTKNGEVTYFKEHLDVFLKNEQGQLKKGGECVHKGILFIASPTDDSVYALDIVKGEEKVYSNSLGNMCGSNALVSHGDDVWFLPYTGRVVVRWNSETGERKEYTNFPRNMICTNPDYYYECEEQVFSYMDFDGDDVYFSPAWGNMYVKLNSKTGEMQEWNPPFKIAEKDNGYYFAGIQGYYLHNQGNGREHCLYSVMDGKLYQIDYTHHSYEEISISFDMEELKRHEAGFGKCDEWLQYGCVENWFNSLDDFLDENIIGGKFDREAQIKAYKMITANYDGTCGEKVHEFVMKKMQKD